MRGFTDPLPRKTDQNYFKKEKLESLEMVRRYLKKMKQMKDIYPGKFTKPQEEQ